MSLGSLSSYSPLVNSNCSASLETDLNDAINNVASWVRENWDVTIKEKKWVTKVWQGSNSVVLDIRLMGSDGKIRTLYLGLFELIEYNTLDKKFYALKSQDMETKIKDRIAICFRDRIHIRAKL